MNLYLRLCQYGFIMKLTGYSGKAVSSRMQKKRASVFADARSGSQVDSGNLSGFPLSRELDRRVMTLGMEPSE